MKLLRISVWIAVLVAAAVGQTDPKPVPVGGGVKAPRVKHKVDPTFTDEAREARVQGTLALSIVVDAAGKPKDIFVVNPLGFGLDEKAIAAVEQWRFEPATRDGKPVPVYAEVQVTFSLGISYDNKAEDRRLAYNRAIIMLGRADTTAATREKELQHLTELAAQQYPPAMDAMGRRYDRGDGVPADHAKALELYEKAAKKHYGPAMFDLGLTCIKQDPEKCLRMIQDASALGSHDAQLYLGDRYERGDGVPQDIGRAMRNYRLCATVGRDICQFRLGKLLLPSERDHVQGVAWLQLAAAQGFSAANQLADEETPKLTEAQSGQAAKWREQLVRMH